MCALSSGAGCLVWLLTLPGVSTAPAVPSAPRVAAPAGQAAQAQLPLDTQAHARGREFFFSWGYNGDSYSRSDIHISQPSLGNDFTLAGVRAHDSKAWTDLFSHGLTVPQYNVRLGVFFNDRWGLEMALDHIKWIVTEGQLVPITGTLQGAPVDTDVALTEDVLRYKLNNGANPIFFNLIRRMPLAGTRGRTGYFTLLLKAGGGFAIPHTENALFGQANDAGFQPFHGWNLDAGAAARVHLWKVLYFELEDKFVYARYFGVNVDQGKAGHSLKANEWSFHFGVSVW